VDPKYRPLFTSWKIGNVEIKNRIVLLPMGGTSLFGWMEPNHFDKEAAAFFLERAKNNVGLIIPGIAPLRDPILGRWLWQNPKMFRDLKKYMIEFHKTGAKLFVQLTAGFGRSFAVTDPLTLLLKNRFLGAIAKPVIDAEYLCASPSELPSRWADGITCRALTAAEIEEMISAFQKTAKLCMDAGVDGVEIHAVHEGYLLDQFTYGYTNHRTDEWGGSFENRYRLPVRIVRAIKEACGEDYPVSLRYSVVSKTKGFQKGALPGETYTEVGRDMEESERAVRYLEEAGYDMLNADNGTYDAWYWAHPPAYMPKNCNLEDVAHIRGFVSIPVVCAGRMDPETGAAAISDGRIDAVGMARQFLVDPEWVTKLMDGREEDIEPCICCHNGCFNMAHYKGVANDQDFSDTAGMARCALNPRTMQSKKYRIIRTNEPKKIAVIGGGIGGMETARVAALRGHKVSIYEKKGCLGGVFLAAAAPSFKEKDRELIAWYRREIGKLPIEVHLNTEVTDPAALEADEIVIATGAKPKRIPVPGVELAMEACEYLLGEKEPGENVVIIGGGLTGCEIAYDLFLQGKKPVIVEMKNDLIAVKGVCLANASYLRDFFEANGVPVYLETSLVSVSEKGVTVKDNAGKTFDIPADSVILSVGYDPAPLVKGGKHVRIVGDACRTGNLRTVIWSAWDVAMKL
jgi:2-enoate reductase